MKRSTFRILFYLNRSKIKKNGCCPVMGSITVDGGVTSFSTGRETRPQDWDAKRGVVSSRSADAKEINRSLNHIREQLQRHYDRIVERDGCITAELLKNELAGSASENTWLLAEARAVKDEIVKGMNITHTISTCKGYQSCIKKLSEYVNTHLGMEDIAFTAVDRSFVENYEFFLRVHKKHTGLTVNNHMRFLRKIINIAVRKKMIRCDLFEGYRHAKYPSQRKWLSQQELQAVMKVSLSYKNANLVRHMFIFSAFTGLSKADIMKLKESDIRASASGGKEIRIRRLKTDTECIVPLGKIPLQIIRMYDGKESGGRIFPKISESDVWRFTGHLAFKAGLDIDLTFHMARHTFSTLCLSKGMGIETLSRILGHRSIRTTQIYAKITNSKIAEDMKNVALLLESTAVNYATNDVMKPAQRVSGI